MITINADISTWENTPSDITLRAGDVITIPKKPNFVLSYGEVYNPNAITYKPGKTAEWYLRQAGGPTELANKKGHLCHSGQRVGGVVEWNRRLVFRRSIEYEDATGDVLVVPEKFVTGSSAWKTTLETAQFLTSLALAAAVVAKL